MSDDRRLETKVDRTPKTIRSLSGLESLLRPQETSKVTPPTEATGQTGQQSVTSGTQSGTQEAK